MYKYKKLPSKDKQVELIRRISREFKVPVYFYKHSGSKVGIGYHKFHSLKKTDSIHILSTCKDLLSTFFHELGHSHCYRNGIWPSYHGCNAKVRNSRIYYTTRDLRSKILTGFKAELWVEDWGRKTFKQYFPNLSYTVGYINNKDSRDWLMENHLSRFKEILEFRGEHVTWKNKR